MEDINENLHYLKNPTSILSKNTVLISKMIFLYINFSCNKDFQEKISISITLYNLYFAHFETDNYFVHAKLNLVYYLIYRLEIKIENRSRNINCLCKNDFRIIRLRYKTI